MRANAYRSYLLAILLAIYTLNYTDYVAFGIALQNVKMTLHLSDAKLGLLAGIAFAAFTAIVGIPISRWIDRGNRVVILTTAAAVWSVMVMLTGRVFGFAQLLAARVGVGLGLATSFPVAQSLIPEYFGRAERPRATAVFMLGWPVALFLGLFGAGWLNQGYGWRAMFLVIGLPGFILAALGGFTLREPRLGRTAESLEESGRPTVNYSQMREVLATLWRNTTYRNLLMSYTVSSFFSTGVFQWQPAFFMRSFGLRSAEVGTGLAVVLGAGALLSTYTGGALATRYAANNERMQFRIMALCYVLFGVTHALAYVSTNAYVAFGLLGIGAFVNAVNGPLLASIQTLVPARMRATSYAVLLLFSNLIGLGLGPVAAGVLSDALHLTFGQESLRYALLGLCPGFVWGAYYMWRASFTVTRDLAVASRCQQGEDVRSAAFRI